MLQKNIDRPEPSSPEEASELQEFLVRLPHATGPVFIGVVPPEGRYFRVQMNSVGTGVYRATIAMPRGRSLYHYLEQDQNLEKYRWSLASWGTGLPNGLEVIETPPKTLDFFEFLPESPFFFQTENANHASRTLSTEVRIRVRQKLFSKIELGWLNSASSNSNSELPLEWVPLSIESSSNDLRVFQTKWTSAHWNRFLFRVQTETGKTYYFDSRNRFSSEIDPSHFFRAPALKSIASNLRAPALGIYHLQASCVKTQPGTSFLAAVVQQLDSLEEMGLDWLYLGPLTQAVDRFGYATVSLDTLDPRLGTKEQLHLLMSECRQRGIKVLVDFVLNHCSVDFFAFQDLLKNQERSQYQDWFEVLEFPVAVEKNRYSAWSWDPLFPHFNLKNPDVRTFLIQNTQSWIREFGIDGLRIDSAAELGLDFLNELNVELKASHPETITIAEWWNHPRPVLSCTDGFTDYPLRLEGIERHLSPTRVPVPEFISELANLISSRMSHEDSWSLNLSSTHDLRRLADLIAHERIPGVLALNAVLGGTPVIFAGDEYCWRGQDIFPIGKSNLTLDRHSLVSWISSLQKIRKRFSCFAGWATQIRGCPQDPDAFILTRENENAALHLVLQYNGEPRSFSFREFNSPEILVGVLARDGTALPDEHGVLIFLSQGISHAN